MLFFKKVNEDFLVDKMGVWHTRYFVFSGIGSGLSTLGSGYGKDFEKMGVINKVKITFWNNGYGTNF